MALTKTSIIKTRSQSRTGPTPRTGTNVRTNDDTIAPAPVAVGTTGRTIDVAPVAVVTTNDPVPVTDDLFARRPKTGAPKDPPPAVPAPRDRDSDPDSDAKKPAAKGRPKKVVAPTAAPKTRKPRKPRTVDANELVDPMSRVQVHDATGVVTAGGIARAGGNDPVLADPDYKKSGTPRSGTVR